MSKMTAVGDSWWGLVMGRCFQRKKPRHSRHGSRDPINRRKLGKGLALTCFETPIGLVNHVSATFAPDNPAVPMAILQ